MLCCSVSYKILASYFSQQATQEIAIGWDPKHQVHMGVFSAPIPLPPCGNLESIKVVQPEQLLQYAGREISGETEDPLGFS